MLTRISPKFGIFWGRRVDQYGSLRRASLVRVMVRATLTLTVTVTLTVIITSEAILSSSYVHYTSVYLHSRIKRRYATLFHHFLATLLLLALGPNDNTAVSWSVLRSGNAGSNPAMPHKFWACSSMAEHLITKSCTI